MSDEIKSLRNENKFYLRKMGKMRKKMKEMEEESKVDKKFQEEVIQENKKLEEDLLYYRFYAYTLDRSGDCDLRKEDVDYFTDDPALRKTLYDRIGYEQEDYKSFGVMFVEKEDGDEDDIDFFDTEEEALKLCNKIISSNKTSPHPYPEGKLILFRSHDYNPDYDNENSVPIVREMILNH